MSQPQPKIDTRAPALAEAPARPRDNGPRPLAVTAVTTRRPSPVHGLQSNVERAFAAPAMSDERKIPFAVTLAGVSAFSLTCWVLLFLLIKAL